MKQMPRGRKKSKNENIENEDISIDEIIDEAEKIEKELDKNKEDYTETELDEHEDKTSDTTIQTETENIKYEKGYCKEHGFVKPIIKSSRPACPYCQRFVIVDPKKIEELLSSDDKKEEEISEIPEIKPPDIEFIENCIKFLRKNLPNVYGIDNKKRAEVIIQTIEQNPNILYNPVALYIHIKNFAPRANDYHLCWILNAMYSQAGGLPQQTLLQLQGMQNLTSPALLSLLNLPQVQQQFRIPIGFMNMQQTPYAPFYNIPLLYTQPLQHVPSQTTQNENQSTKKSKKIYKVVTEDGTVIETDDPEEYRALVDWIERRKREKEEWELRKQEWEERRRREEREWELRIKKLEEELKKKKDEEKASTDKRKEDNELVKMLLTRIDAVTRELNETRQKYEELKEEVIEAEKRALEERIKILEDELRALREYTSNPFKILEEYEKFARSLGYTKTGKNVLDILDKGMDGVHQTINNLINKLQPVQRQPEVKYTEKERIEKLQQVKESIKISEDILQAEEEVIKAAEKIYSSNTQTAKQNK